MAEEQKNKTAGEREIDRQIASTPDDERKTGNVKAEQPLKVATEEVPDEATLARGYYKWTDNDGNFRKVPIDGTNAVREPAHEQHELTVEDRDRLYEAAALKTPRRDDAKAGQVFEKREEIHNDDYNVELTRTSTPVKAAAKDDGEIKDAHPELHDQGQPVKATAGGAKGTVSESADANARDNR